MSAISLGSRAVIGEFYRRLSQEVGGLWIDGLSMLFSSDQDSETYSWLGQTPAMREWIGGRNAKGFRENGLTIRNKHFESTLKVLVRDMRRDKSGQVMVRIGEQATRATSHWASLLSTLILNGESTLGYDGQFFFDIDHSEGESGVQSNDIAVDISALPVTVSGSVTAPSVEQIQQTIMKGVTQILGFVDDQGEPMNENAQSFLVMMPNSLFIPAINALSVPKGMTDSMAIPANMNISVVTNARLSTWTDQFAVFRTDGDVKPFIRQQETPIKINAQAEGSDEEFRNDTHLYGLDAWRNVGYGFWQHACLVKMV